MGKSYAAERRSGFALGDRIRKVFDDTVYVVTGLHVDGTAYATKDAVEYVQEVTILRGKAEYWVRCTDRHARKESSDSKLARILADGN